MGRGLGVSESLEVIIPTITSRSWVENVDLDLEQVEVLRRVVGE